MEVLVNTSHVILPALYTALVIAYARIFARGPSGLALFVRPLLIGTVAVHLASIGLISAMLGSCPLGSSAEFLSLMAFSITVIYLVIELRWEDRTLGIFAITPAFVLQVVAGVGILSRDGPPDVALGVRESLHIFAAIIGSAAVALASVFALLYLFLYLAIKRGSFGLFYRKMPSLEKLSDLNVTGMSTAFLALTVTVALGVWDYVRGDAGSMSFFVQPAVLLTLLLWGIYGLSLVAQRFLQLGGKRLALVTLLGLPFLVAIVASGLFSSGFHA